MLHCPAARVDPRGERPLASRGSTRGAGGRGQVRHDSEPEDASTVNDHRDLWWPSPTITHGQAVRLDLSEPFTAHHGGTLTDIQVSYQSWGPSAAAAEDTVLVVHPMTADCHVTGEAFGHDPGWWEPLVGPGRAIDTDRHFVVCPNLIGGCYGTTGPRFPAPDGSPYFDRFPLLTPRDMMRVQRLFLDAIGVRHLRMVIGPSMGGMIAWEWAIEASDWVDRVVVVAAPLRTSAHQIGLNWLQRRGIETDLDGNEVVAKVGQLLARGVGMLSYRSPAGLEAKFGREWFTEPGSTLGERGMFNVESWLRHHGKRIAKRFDPYTYLLFSRAMDLHDVSDGRGDVIAVLDRVRTRVEVVGISTDALYSPEEVHFGAHVLGHLGRDVHYSEIRSPHGHDAFLLETEQIDAILRAGDDRGHARPVVASERLRGVRVAILGAGRVARSFVGLCRERRDGIADRNGLALELTAVADLEEAALSDPAFDGLDRVRDPDALVDREDVDVIVDLTRGLGAKPFIERALRSQRPVVTPNKPLVRAFGDELERLALQSGVRIAFHDSIAAGWPLIYTVERPLDEGRITGIRAMLSSSMNVALEAIESGASFEDAMVDVVSRGLTEPDPELDVVGWDSAQKLAILLAHALERRYHGDDLSVRGVADLDVRLVRGAGERGYRIKLVAAAECRGDESRAAVSPMAVRADGHLGSVRGTDHVVLLETADGELAYFGAGAGTLPVATAVLNDLVGLFDSSHSWTGTYPRASAPLPGLGFSRWLTIGESGKTSILETAPTAVTGSPDGRAVPILSTD